MIPINMLALSLGIGQTPFENYKVRKHFDTYDNRWKVSILNKKNSFKRKENEKKRRMTLARYLMSISLGRELKTEEQVDHIDNDCTNDDISNLQILTHKENMSKFNKFKAKGLIHGTLNGYNGYKCRCIYCKEAWTKYQLAYYHKYKVLKSGTN